MAMIADMNGDFRDGYCALPMSNSPQRRASSALCYLDADVRARQNLTILQQATASEIVFDGRRAVGVKATVAGEAREFVGARIILAAGGIQSPALLLRSGIGPGGTLRPLGIEMRADLPASDRTCRTIRCCSSARICARLRASRRRCAPCR
jgi:5-(hydroxymethyl)furfural/furfural oxidase